MPTSPSTLRVLTATDLNAYKELRDSGLQHDPEAFTSDFDTARELPAATYATRLGQPPQDDFILGAFDPDGGLVGAVICERKAHLKKRHEAELVGMMIAPGKRGRGIGRAMLREFDRLVRKLPGLEQVILHVNASHQRAIKLYESAGFVRCGIHPRAWKIDGVYHDTVLMQKQLGPEPEP